jgi:hypothetical protein
MTVAFLSLLFLICLGLAIARDGALRGRKAAPATDVRQIRADCTLLLELLTLLQQHRGMSSAFLSGELAFLASMQKKQGQIAALQADLSRLARREGGTVSASFGANDFALLNFRWECLLDELPMLTAEQSIARHSQLIARVLEWLAAFGNSRLALLSDDVLAQGLIRNFTDRLPQLTECLGQVRAIGTCVAGRQACSPTARVKLIFLLSRADSLLDQALAVPFDCSARQASLFAIRELLAAVRTKMLLSSGVMMSAEEFFLLATRTIDQLFLWIDQYGEGVGQLMDKVAVIKEAS